MRLVDERNPKDLRGERRGATSQLNMYVVYSTAWPTCSAAEL
jgi:hypothetical protein